MDKKLFEALSNWNPETQLTVKVRFVKRGTDAALTGQQYTVRLYDKDVFTDDDYLGQARLNEHGEAHIHFYPADIRKTDLGLEQYPDLYILLFKGDTVHFQSKVWDDVDFAKEGTLTLNEGEVVDFGTFLVD
ncbi:MAG: hypothetical protein KIS94_14000 [Chitinophagales bacterium]|nr:hypothetical protein [Chitinophagales bacterium]